MGEGLVPAEVEEAAKEFNSKNAEHAEASSVEFVRQLDNRLDAYNSQTSEALGGENHAKDWIGAAKHKFHEVAVHLTAEFAKIDPHILVPAISDPKMLLTLVDDAIGMAILPFLPKLKERVTQAIQQRQSSRGEMPRGYATAGVAA